MRFSPRLPCSGNLCNTGDVAITGDQVGVQHNYAATQNLAEAAKEIQALLDQLAQTYPTATETETAEAVKQIEQKPELKARIVGALEKGGKKALEKLVDHPAAAIAIAVYDGWKEAQKGK
ncbi:hypothetical protein K9N68_01275 [Kovacikia minuta CCNUW1]|uniref:hypothetical protein n=1 Tax=Kovacikia minuta TaxID=2931930 RepID=UPI001CCCF965|nr:hypothetical protein [Kovacikia minuta]UBF26671.1 hypothetical protein K9N68_01275 [Kovacikia minuta CCNUW1]